MPSFGRIGRQSNRSQNALASGSEPPTPTAPGPGPPLPPLPSGLPGPGGATAQGAGGGRAAAATAAAPVGLERAQGRSSGIGEGPSPVHPAVAPAPAHSTVPAPAAVSPQGQVQQGHSPNAALQGINPASDFNTNVNPNTSTAAASNTAGATPGSPLSASPAHAFSTQEAFDHALQQQRQHYLQQQQQQLDQLEPPQQRFLRAGDLRFPSSDDSIPPATTIAAPRRGSQPLQTASPAPLDPRQPQNDDLAYQVARSQSQRHSVVPVHAHPHYAGAASTSLEDLPTSFTFPPPPGAPPNQQQGSHPAHQTQPQPQPEQKRSTRQLIKNIFTGSSRDQQQQQQRQQQQKLPSQPSHPSQASSYDNTTGLARRPSKRVSNNQPYARPGLSQVSQVSLDQPPDWQTQTSNLQPSPLQGYGELEDPYFTRDSDRELVLQNVYDQNLDPSRFVTGEPESASPHEYEDSAYEQHPHAQIHLQSASPDQYIQYGQGAFEAPARQQSQGSSHLPPQELGNIPRGPSRVGTGSSVHLEAWQQQNPETVSQVSHESPTADSGARSPHKQSTQVSPSSKYPAPDSTHSPARPPSQHGASQQQQQQQTFNMAPGGSSASRKQEAEKMLRGQAEVPSGYRHSQSQGGSLSSSGNNANLRAGSGQERPPPQFDAQGSDQGRNSPQPSNSERDANDPDRFKELVTKYKNVKRLYFEGKSQIDLLNGQIEQLQNAVANQRITQSRTALDDSEYLTRFNRLNGAINNLSFNIRKDWKTVPQWLDKYVSADALKTGKQEMTAVGRAVITRWIAEEIFGKCFHPGLNFEFSRHLKDIEKNIRRFSYTMSAQEEFNALTTKVVNWRMATLEGLQGILNSPESADNRTDFTSMCTTNLTATLYQYLSDPPPAGVDGSASMIVELAVGIAANLPLESRDVALTYPLPGDAVDINIMDVEKSGLPAIETQKESAQSDDSEEERGGKNTKAAARSRRADRNLGGNNRSGLPPKDANRVRFAAFLAVEVRNRQVLVKAPVWTLG